MFNPRDPANGTATSPTPASQNNPGAAVCLSHDPELWFPTDQADHKTAVDLCNTCPLAQQCRTDASARKETGVWGGLLFKEGHVIRTFPQRGRPSKRTPKAA